MFSEDPESRRGILSLAGNIRTDLERIMGNPIVVWEELCYGKTQTLGDGEDAAR